MKSNTIITFQDISQDTIPIIPIFHPVIHQDLALTAFPGPLFIDHPPSLPKEIDNLRKLEDHKDMKVIMTCNSGLMLWLFPPLVILLANDMKALKDPTIVHLVPLLVSFLMRMFSIHQANLIGLRMFLHLTAVFAAIQ